MVLIINTNDYALKKIGYSDLPLIVDLDGTLIREDTTVLLLKSLVKSRPLKLLSLLRYIFYGRATFKTYLANLISLDQKKVKINNDVIKWLEGEKELGRKIILCSGAPESIVRFYYSNFKLFSSWYSSTDTVNLTGNNKASLLVSLYGVGGFDYVGNSLDDLHVWKNARHCILANTSKSVKEKLNKLSIKAYKEF